MSPTHTRIKHLYAQSVLSTLQAILVFIAALFSTALLPSLVLRYLYPEPDFLTPPPVIEYIPVVSFAISASYFLYVIATNMRRGMTIKKLQKDAELEALTCGDCANCGCGDAHTDNIDMHELQELEAMVDAALEAKPTNKTKKTTRRKKTTKK